MRLSLKDLFVILAFGAVMSWCAAEAGTDNILFWVVAALSSGMAVAFVSIAKRKHGRWLTLLMPPVLLVVLFLPLISGMFLHSLAVFFVAGVVCTILPPMSVRTLCAVAMGCMAASFVWSAIAGRARLRELAALRQQYPVATLASRLAYEHPRPDAVPVAMNSTVATELATFENSLKGRYREWQLKRLHSRQYELFVRSDGFGVQRVPRPSRESLSLSPLRDIAFDESRTQVDYDYGDWSAAWSGDSSSDGVKGIHVASRNDFLDADGFGAIMTPLTQVVGFVEHALHFPPAQLMKESNDLKVERLELVSLLKSSEPRVYVLDHLPRMDQLASDNVPTRPLDDFESVALQALRTNDDVIVAENDGQYRMLGSLRAAKQCLDCHSVQRAELLGAFSYVIRQKEKVRDESLQAGAEEENAGL